MKQLIFLFLFALQHFLVQSQSRFIAVIKDADEKKYLEGASVIIKKLRLSATSDDKGLVVLNNVPAGQQVLEFSLVGYKETEKVFSFPMTGKDTVGIFLEPDEEQLQDVTVSSTRSRRSIANTPTRVEVISKDEIHEEAEIRPGDIKMLLAESTGIQMQQTSATSAGASIRIQGLDGRYTQILKDGFPVYAGAATGLGLLQTPPLDLRQVEIIKGSSSTLYGGGAIAGLINLISKIPEPQRELGFNINGTTAGGLDINGFYGERFKKTGVTVFASRNSNKAYDPADISLSAIPKFERYTVNPKLFLYLNEKTSFSFGVNTTFEDRLGGDMQVIEGKADSLHSYFEHNKTQRLSSQLVFDHAFNPESNFNLKNSISYFHRIINSPGYTFDGTQYSTFTEASYFSKKENTDWVAGLNIFTNQFAEKPLTPVPVRNYTETTLGAFLQNTSNVFKWFTLETGLRGDYVNNYGFAFLPRISALFKVSPKLTSRLSGGLGYKTPTIFTEESEKLLYKDVLAVNPDSNELEKSYGVNWDVNYITSFDKISFSINQFFFYTYLNHPIFLEPVQNELYQFQNISGHLSTKGAETNIKIGYGDFSLYLGYTYIDAKVHNEAETYQNPLTPRHRFNSAIVYEVENDWKFGSELYYFSPQALNDGTTGRDYWLAGFLAEKLWKKFSIYINFENLGDVRQTKFGSIYTGSLTNPMFKDIYAPLEGFVANGGVRVKI